MAQPTTSVEPPGTPASRAPGLPATEHLRRGIAARKRHDRVFAIGGASLIFLSLLVLVALVANLLVDGWGPLWQTHEIKADQSGFGRKELVGTLVKADAAKPPGWWLLQLDTLALDGVKDPASLAGLVGRQVGVRGKLARPPGTEMDVSSIQALAPGEPSTGFDLTGVLGRQTVESAEGMTREAYTLRPAPFALGLSGVSAPELSEGDRVAVDPKGKVKPGEAIEVSELTPLVAKNFFTSFPSRDAGAAGILSAWVGTLLIMLVTVTLAVPMGVAAGVYLEEYAPKNRLTALIEINIANLAGVPSIIWGLMALGLFVYILKMDRSVQVAGMTLGLLVLPIVIIATREAIRAIPSTIREASYGLGATKWQTVRHHIIPYSMSGILTGSIIAMSRAIGETAPLVTIGALTFIAFLPPPPVDYKVPAEEMTAYERAVAERPATAPPPPEKEVVFQPFEWLDSAYTVMPIQLFQWISRPQKEFHNNAAAAGIVLLAMTLGLNGIAIFIRYRLRKGIKW